MVNKAKVGRFDGEIKEYAFEDGKTVSDLLNTAGLTLGTGEGVNDDDGDKVELTTDAINGETYYIVGSYKQGA